MPVKFVTPVTVKLSADVIAAPVSKRPVICIASTVPTAPVNVTTAVFPPVATIKSKPPSVAPVNVTASPVVVKVVSALNVVAPSIVIVPAPVVVILAPRFASPDTSKTPVSVIAVAFKSKLPTMFKSSSLPSYPAPNSTSVAVNVLASLLAFVTAPVSVN